MATQGVDTTLRISFGIVHGLLLAMAFPLFYVILPMFTQSRNIIVLVFLFLSFPMSGALVSMH